MATATQASRRNGANSHQPSHQPKQGTAAYGRSKVSNGKSLFVGNIDERGKWPRRFRDLLSDYVAALGGENISPQKHAIARFAATMKVECELLERKFALDGKGASSNDLILYAQISSACRRQLESVGLKYVGKLKNVTPEEDLDDIDREIDDEQDAAESESIT